MNFRRIKNSWFVSNKHYLIPVFLFAAAVNAAVAIAFALAAIGIWGLNKMRARLPIDSGPAREPETLVYRTVGSAELRLDLWKPAGGRPGTATIVFAHGGGWISGSRNQPNNVSWCRFLADRGFSVASIDYRFAYTNKMANIIDDFSAAVGYIRENAETLGLSRKLVLMGLSAGGHLALCHAAFNTFSQDKIAKKAMEGVCGVVAYYSPSDLKDLFSPEDKSFFARFSAGTAMKSFPRFDEESYEKYSPVNSFTKHMVPVMAVHGRLDETVPYASSVKMIKKLKELGVYCRFLVHKTGGHGFEVRRKDYRTTLILEETVRFIRRIS